MAALRYTTIVPAAGSLQPFDARCLLAVEPTLGGVRLRHVPSQLSIDSLRLLGKSQFTFSVTGIFHQRKVRQWDMLVPQVEERSDLVWIQGAKQ